MRNVIRFGRCKFELVGSVGMTSPKFPVQSEPGEVGVGFRMLQGVSGPFCGETILEVQNNVWNEKHACSELVTTWYQVNEKGQLREIDLSQVA